MNRKIDAMHEEYGFNAAHKCMDCCNLVHVRYSRTYLKCSAYGESSSTATDWAGKWFACGLYGKDFSKLKRKPLIEALKRMSQSEASKATEPLDGQIEL